ncbi:MAG: hypothetical protein AB7S26_01345 [Sandaracinaceae bacterium]
MRLTSTDAFVEWAEREYLTELVLVRASKRGVRVGMRDLEHSGAGERFFVWSFVQRGARRWEVEGALDRDVELTFERADDVEANVALRFRAGGVALLACDALDVEALPPIVRRAKPRPWQSDFTMWSHDTELTVGQLLALLGLPKLVSYEGPTKVAAPEWKLAELRSRSHRAWYAADGDRGVLSVAPVHRGREPGWTIGIQRRRAATDAEWDRAWRLPLALPVYEILSRTVRTDPAGWAKLEWRAAMVTTIFE